MLNFKLWIEEYSDEDEIHQIRQIPLKCSLLTNELGYNVIKFKMPMGELEEYRVAPYSKISDKASIGSLNSSCFNFYSKQDFGKLYQLLKTIKMDNNEKISNQVVKWQ